MNESVTEVRRSAFHLYENKQIIKSEIRQTEESSIFEWLYSEMDASKWSQPNQK